MRTPSRIIAALSFTVGITGILLVTAQWFRPGGMGFGAGTAVAAIPGIAFVLGLLAAVMAVAWERGRSRLWMATGFAAVLVSGALATRAVFAGGMGEGARIGLTVLLGWVGFTALGGGLVALRTARPWVRRVRMGTIGMAGLLAAAIVLGVCAGPRLSGGARYRVEEAAERVAAAAAILCGCGALAVLLGARGERLLGLTPAAPRAWFTIECPRCGRRQRLRTDGDTCAGCRLGIRVTPL